MSDRRLESTVVVNATNIGRSLDGIGTYSLNLVRHLCLAPMRLQFVIYLNRAGAEHFAGWRWPPHCTPRWVSGRMSPDHRFRGHLRRLLFAWYLGARHRRELIFNTSQLEAIPFRSNQVITIHDIIPLLFKEQHRRQYHYYKYLLEHALRPARALIVPSVHTKGLLQEQYGLPGGKICVIYHGRCHVTGGPNGSGPRERLVLYVGRLAPLKNVGGVLQAFALVQDCPGSRLVVVGEGREKPWQELACEASVRHGLDLERVVFAGQVPEAEMRRLLRRAALLVFPSFYEGFGLPPLEAMACGCPVVVSRVASLPEVCGEAALYVHPHDVRGIAAAMRAILENAALAGAMSERGLAQARRFSWRQSAEAHLQVLGGTLQPATGSDELAWKGRRARPAPEALR